MTIIHYIVAPERGDIVIDHFADMCAKRGVQFSFAKVVGQETKRPRKATTGKVICSGYFARPMGYVERMLDSIH